MTVGILLDFTVCCYCSLSPPPLYKVGGEASLSCLDRSEALLVFELATRSDVIC